MLLNDKNVFFVKGSIRNLVLYINEIMTTEKYAISVKFLRIHKIIRMWKIWKKSGHFKKNIAIFDKNNVQMA